MVSTATTRPERALEQFGHREFTRGDYLALFVREVPVSRPDMAHRAAAIGTPAMAA